MKEGRCKGGKKVSRQGATRQGLCVTKEALRMIGGPFESRRARNWPEERMKKRKAKTKGKIKFPTRRLRYGMIPVPVPYERNPFQYRRLSCLSYRTDFNLDIAFQYGNE